MNRHTCVVTHQRHYQPTSPEYPLPENLFCLCQKESCLYADFYPEQVQQKPDFNVMRNGVTMTTQESVFLQNDPLQITFVLLLELCYYKQSGISVLLFTGE